MFLRFSWLCWLLEWWFPCFNVVRVLRSFMLELVVVDLALMSCEVGALCVVVVQWYDGDVLWV